MSDIAFLSAAAFRMALFGLTWYYPPHHPWPWPRVAVRLQHRKPQPNTSSCLSWRARPGVIEEVDARLVVVKDGSVTWSATAVAPASLPTMASLVTGCRLPNPGITWNVFEFSRGYPAPDCVLSRQAGRTAPFLWMESLCQLAAGTVYRLSDVEATEGRVQPRPVGRVRAGLLQITSGSGYGRLSLPISWWCICRHRSCR